MTLRSSALAVLPLALAGCSAVSAQQLIGYVSTRDASVTGASDVMDERAVLTGAVSVASRDHPANVTLARGGRVSVCQASLLHMTESREVSVAAPLLFSLDRGAIEIHTRATASDAIMTPDLRFTVRNSGPLDLRLRIAANGDTCVDNRGPLAPTLAVSDPFGDSQFEVAAGQHVVFEHGSLQRAATQENIPCGCPQAKGTTLADALLAPPVASSLTAASSPADASLSAAAPASGPAGSPASGSPPDAVTAASPSSESPAASEDHPFPATASGSVAAPGTPPVLDSNPDRPSLVGGLIYNGATPPGDAAGSGSATDAIPPAGSPTGQPRLAASASGTDASSSASAPAPSPRPKPANPAGAPAASPVKSEPPKDVAHFVGRFFRRLFGHR